MVSPADSHCFEGFVVRKGTLAELFAFNDWARDGLLRASAGIDDERLDRPFEMGEGSLRKTLNHLYSAELVWLDRWEGRLPRYRVSAEGVTVAGLGEEFRDVARRRNDFLNRLGDSELARRITYVNLRGKTYTYPLGAMMLHVCNHGSHHRAQAVNMLRRVGAPIPPPGLDYIFMKLEAPGATPGRLDVNSLRTYFRCSDWAQKRILDAASGLSGEQLDRPFEIGLGTLRKTLVHICDAEQWWDSNWTQGPCTAFPAADAGAPLQTIVQRYAETSKKRNGFLETLGDGDLVKPVSATPRPGVQRTYPLGVTMLQLCHHGTHHRAQALNMLRHVGAAVPELDALGALRTDSA